MDSEGALPGFSRATLVHIVGEEEVEALDQFGQVKTAPLVELRKRNEINCGSTAKSWTLGSKTQIREGAIKKSDFRTLV